MRWQTPSFVEINMSAEIGGYGADFSDHDPMGPVVEPVSVERTVDRTPVADGAQR